MNRFENPSSSCRGIERSGDVIVTRCKFCEAESSYPVEMAGRRAECSACLRLLKVPKNSKTRKTLEVSKHAHLANRDAAKRNADRNVSENRNDDRNSHAQVTGQARPASEPARPNAPLPPEFLPVQQAMSPQRRRLNQEQAAKANRLQATPVRSPGKAWLLARVVGAALTVLSLVIGGITITVRHVTEVQPAPPRVPIGVHNYESRPTLPTNPSFTDTAVSPQQLPIERSLSNIERINEINRQNRERLNQQMRRHQVPVPKGPGTYPRSQGLPSRNTSPSRSSPSPYGPSVPSPYRR